MLQPEPLKTGTHPIIDSICEGAVGNPAPSEIYRKPLTMPEIGSGRCELQWLRKHQSPSAPIVSGLRCDQYGSSDQRAECETHWAPVRGYTLHHELEGLRARRHPRPRSPPHGHANLGASHERHQTPRPHRPRKTRRHGPPAHHLSHVTRHCWIPTSATSPP